ncbi:catalase [Sporanaerobium hydrogeniformans]|uniref:Catalase n=1 Tax=Sporanaerobium hydrogeniformans TaxID=3072179 RepID=A0AC61DE73_9FIRM|nr:catalase [Sporanaerobium hydrogeniformans]PHV71579.1 catalase [Sporanaerobium hydrogeniformans]
MDNKKVLTTSLAKPIDNDQASLTTGKKVGYTLMGDVDLFQKLAHFNRERIPERVVHAKGSGAFGYFEVTNDLSKYTMAKFLKGVGKKTPVLARFSTVGGEKGSADTARDPRGFALKFYTEDGNYDLVGNNTPVFFIRDAIKFPDFIHTQKRDPQNNLKDPNMFWDFLSLTPESLLQVMRLFSNLGTPKGFRHMDGFGSHTFMWYNEKKDYHWIKYHFLTDQGIENFTQDEAILMAGKNPDYATQDLFNAIEKGNYPSWSCYIQIMTPKQASNYRFNPFDVTKTWDETDFPLIPLGKLVLNRNPDNFFAEIEQAAFAPSHFVPGIGPSPDKLLQGRLIAYTDAHNHRLGPNSFQIPVNTPNYSNPYTNQRDGMMTVNGNFGSHPNYYPTTLADVAVTPSVSLPPMPVDGIIAKHTIESDEQDYILPGEFFNTMDHHEKAHTIYNLTQSLMLANPNLQYRQTALFYKVDPILGNSIAEVLGLDKMKVHELANLTQEERVKATLKPYTFYKE